MPGQRSKTAREQRRAGERAALKVARAATNPIEVANENEKLRSAQRGAHALTHVLVRRLAGFNVEVTVPFAEWNALPPNEHLKLTTLPNGDAVLRLERE